MPISTACPDCARRADKEGRKDGGCYEGCPNAHQRHGRRDFPDISITTHPGPPRPTMQERMAELIQRNENLTPGDILLAQNNRDLLTDN